MSGSRIDLKIDFSCNNLCRFCVQGDKRERFRGRTTAEILKILEEGRGSASGVVLTGGEPTLRKDIFEIVEGASRSGYTTIQIQTNGRMLAYKDFARRLVRAGANEFSPALHGHTPYLHDFLTRVPGSFEQTVLGIRNIKGFGRKVIANTVVTKPNYLFLPEIAALLVRLGVDQFQFAAVHPVGRAGENFEAIVPRFSLMKEYLLEGLRRGIGAGIEVMTEAIPPCILGEYRGYIAESSIPFTKVFDAEGVIEDYREMRISQGKVRGPPCLTCDLEEGCEGPWKEYPAFYGWEEFKPMRAHERVLPSQDWSSGPLLTLSEDRREAEMVIKTSCQNRCLFCTTRIVHEERGVEWSQVEGLEEVLKGLKSVGEDGAGLLKLVAMEPLEHPEILRVIEGARGLGLDIEIWTSGRLLSYRDFAEEVHQRGVRGLKIPLFGHEAPIHDMVAGAEGAFRDTVLGIGNWTEITGTPPEIHMVVVRQNCRYILETSDFASSELGVPLSFIVIAAPSSETPALYTPFAFEFSEMVKGLSEKRERFGDETFSRAISLLEGQVPPCLLKDLQGGRREPFPSERGKRAPSAERVGYIPGLMEKERAACPRAMECRLAPSCPGIFPLYLKVFGHGEFIPE